MKYLLMTWVMVAPAFACDTRQIVLEKTKSLSGFISWPIKKWPSGGNLPQRENPRLVCGKDRSQRRDVCADAGAWV